MPIVRPRLPGRTRFSDAQSAASGQEEASLRAVIDCLKTAADGRAGSMEPPPIEDERRERRLSAWRERFTRAPSVVEMLVPRSASADSRLSRVRLARGTHVMQFGVHVNKPR